MKKSNIKIIAIILVLVAIFIGAVCIFSEHHKKQGTNENFKNQISVVMSTKTKLADLENKDYAYRADYEKYNKFDNYDVYNCVLKISNNSDLIVSDVNMDLSSGDNYIIDYQQSNNYPFYVAPKQTGYVALTISMKKGISDIEKQEVINSINKLVNVSLCKSNEKKELLFVCTFKDDFSVSNENYLNQNIQYPDNI